jgi:GDP-L-fucose synthase
VEYFTTDVTKVNLCEFHFRKNVFAVFNLAAVVAGVLYNMDNHISMYKSNIDVLAGPVIAAITTGVPHYLQTSSVCVYSPTLNHPSQEEWGLIASPHEANAGYAEAKRDGERLIGWSDLEHAVIVRPSNVYGPFDYFDERAHVIPALVRKAVEEDEIHVYGPQDTVREFIHSHDVAWGMMTALEHGEHGEAYNIGCNGENTLTTRALVEKIRHLADVEDKSLIYHEDVGGGDPLRFSDASKLRDLGWEHTVGLDEGIEETIRWYKDDVG